MMVERFVHKIEPRDENEILDHKPKSLSDFLEQRNLILLGDPGAGKSHTFERAAQEENGTCYTADQFLIYGKDVSPDQAIFVDALDEFRSRSGDSNTVHEIASLINGL